LYDEDCAKSYLAISVARHEPQSIALLIDPPFARFHKTSWFPALLAKAGLMQAGTRRDLSTTARNL